MSKTILLLFYKLFLTSYPYYLIDIHLKELYIVYILILFINIYILNLIFIVV